MHFYPITWKSMCNFDLMEFMHFTKVWTCARMLTVLALLLSHYSRLANNFVNICYMLYVVAVLKAFLTMSLGTRKPS